MQKQLNQKELSEIVDALNTLAKYDALYSGFRRRQRRIAEVRLSKHIVVKYEDGDLRYLDLTAGKTYHFYVHLPPKQ
jgi:hypothetical protein